MMAESRSKICVLCNSELSKNPADDIVTLRKKGSDGINRCSVARGSEVYTTEGDTVHKECRKRWCNQRYINSAKQEQTNTSVKRKLRSETPTFKFSKDCLFCCQPVSFEDRRRGHDSFPVQKSAFEDSIKGICKSRNDEWSRQVLGRLSYSNDLRAEDAVYHGQCSINFRTGKCIPNTFVIDEPVKKQRVSLGRPVEEGRAEAFLFVAEYLKENVDDQITVVKLVNKMKEYLQLAGSTQQPYCVQYMKQKILDHFGDQIMFANLEGLADVVTFQTTASSILQDHYKQPTYDSVEEENKRIIETAAKLLKSDIMKLATCDNYPTPQDLTTEKALTFLPDSLKLFLHTMAVGKNTEKKCASLGHAIIQASKPNVIAPLQLGLAVQMHHHFASRFLVDSLHEHGFCSSYSEVLKFERSAAVTPRTATLITEGQFVQYSADNVDHNIRTLDGHGTFHGMGMIAAVTPGHTVCSVVPRTTVTSAEIMRAGRVALHHYNYPKEQNSIYFRDLALLKRNNIQNRAHKPFTDILWKFSPFLKWPRPGWSGFMQMVHKGNHPGKANVVFLPMIDLDPSDMTCIYSTLIFLADQARSNNVTPVITFDQPLWWKAHSIITNEPRDSKLKSIVLRIGGLHTEMSFWGCIGYLMENSGLYEVLEVVYASNTVANMLSGKALSRARRGHFLVDAALNMLLLADGFQVPLPAMSKPTTSITDDEGNENSLSTSDISQHSHTHKQATEGSLKVISGREISSTDNCITNVDDGNNLMANAKKAFDKLGSDGSLDEETCGAVLQINAKLDEEKASNQDSRTSCMWLQYMKMVDILKRFIRAERTGDWNLHLTSLEEMLPFFTAAGHNLYAKTVYLYLQEMAKLPTADPQLHSKFLAGLHVVRRSDRFWAGLSTDLIIEQVLMRSIKTTGGLTRGKGMTELQRTVWVNSMPACSHIKQAMQEFTGVSYSSNEQHKETSNYCQERDCVDTEKLVSFLQSRNPFKKADKSLRNIVSGVVGEAHVNADEAEAVGMNIIQSMVGQPVAKYSFKRKQQAVTLGSKTALVIDKEAVHIDPQILFQRLTIVAAREHMDTPALFKYELCSYPTALFDSLHTPRPAKKAVLADALWNELKCDQGLPSAQPLYVLDGGALLHRTSWSRGSTFQDICNTYVRYVKDRYSACVVVFDGYSNGPSVKDITHLRRGCKVAVPVHFEPSMPVTVKKDLFLANALNKQQFINLLSENLKEAGCQTVHANADADLLIVQTAVRAASERETVVVADDTDIIILLCYHGNMTTKKLYMKPEPKDSSKKNRVWDIHAITTFLGQRKCKHLPFIHALLGCDTTSHLFGIGKGTSLKKSKLLAQYADTFNSSISTKEEIIKSGEAALVTIYGGKPTDTLDSLRYKRFCKKVAKTTVPVEIKSLPPTAASAKYHSLRVYYQVQVWLGNETLQPTDLGWKLIDGVMHPIMTDMLPAPEQLLRIIKCNCTTGCSNKKCSCRKYGIDCSSACGECHGTACSNSPPTDEEEVDTADH